MTNLNSEVIPGAAAAGGAATATVAIMYGLPYIINKVQNLAEAYKNWREGYNDVELDEFNKIRRIYEQYCLTKNSTDVSLTDFGKSKVNISESNKKFPFHFQMDEKHPKKPRFFTDGYQPVLSVEEWSRHIGNRCNDSIHAVDGIKDLISWICVYQQERRTAFIGGSVVGAGYDYDPTNLFFEEFKSWLVSLSTREASMELLNDIRSRRDYLHAINREGLFDKESKRVQTRKGTVDGLIDRLKTLSDYEERKLILKAAREDCKELDDNVGELIREASAFCFYIFRNTDVPKEWDMGAVKDGRGYFNEATETTQSGELLKNLLTSEIAILAYEQSDKQPGLPNERKSFESKYGHRFDGPYKKKKGSEWGILSEFLEINTMKKFYKLHCLIEKLMEYKIVIKQLYKLSGSYGDMLVYDILRDDTMAILDYYCRISDDMEVLLRDLYRAANIKEKSCRRQPSTEEAKWLNSYKLADMRIEKICGIFEDCTDEKKLIINKSRKIVEQIKKTISKINDSEYKEGRKDELKKFLVWAHYFIASGKAPSENSKNEQRKLGGYKQLNIISESNSEVTKPKIESKSHLRLTGFSSPKSQSEEPILIEGKNNGFDDIKTPRDLSRDHSKDEYKPTKRVSYFSADLKKSKMNLRELACMTDTSLKTEDEPKMEYKPECSILHFNYKTKNMTISNYIAEYENECSRREKSFYDSKQGVTLIALEVVPLIELYKYIKQASTSTEEEDQKNDFRQVCSETFNNIVINLHDSLEKITTTKGCLENMEFYSSYLKSMKSNPMKPNEVAPKISKVSNAPNDQYWRYLQKAAFFSATAGAIGLAGGGGFELYEHFASAPGLIGDVTSSLTGAVVGCAVTAGISNSFDSKNN